MQQQITTQKNNEKVNLLIIYLRLIEKYMITSILTPPPWGNGEGKMGKSGAEWG